MIRKLKSGQYRLHSAKLDPRTRRRRNLCAHRAEQKGVTQMQDRA